MFSEQTKQKTLGAKNESGTNCRSSTRVQTVPHCPHFKMPIFTSEINIFKPSVSTLIQKYKEGFFLLTHSFKSYYSSNGAFLKYGYKNIYDSDILRFQSGSQSRMISNPQPCFIQPKVYVYKKNSSQKSISFLFFINFSNITNTLSSLLLAKFRLPMLVYWWWF